jgi:hypothetical protein
LTILALVPVRAQEFSGIVGTVLDKSGGAIVGVDVALDNEKTGLHLKTTTDGQGVYQFVHIPPADGYALTFTKEGFNKLYFTNISVTVATTSTRNATLEVGVVTQAIEVKASTAETLNTTDASVGNVLDARTIEDLPLLLRENPSTLLGLQAGVTPDAGGGANRAGAVTGARTDQSNITVDGIDANDQAGGFAYTTVGNEPVESIEEFRVTTANPGATDGRSAGGQMQIINKSGTNDFHGAVYEYNRTAATEANDFFNNSAGVPRPALTRNQFGAALGGPVKRDRLFFFFNYEGRRDAQQFAESRTVPLDQVRNGGIAYVHTGKDANGAPCSRTARLNNPVTKQCITLLPATGPTGTVSVASLDPLGIGADPALLTVITGRYPHANDLTGGDGINTGFFRFDAPFDRVHNTYLSKIDFKINSKQTLSGRFTIVRESDTQDVQQFPGDPPAQLFQDHTYAFVIAHTWTINPENVNTLTVGVNRQYNNFPAGPGAFPTFPNEFTFGPYSGAFFNSFNIQGRTVPVPVFRDDYTMIHGKHTFQFGVDIRPIIQKSYLTNDFNFLTLGSGSVGLSNLGPNGSTLRPADFVNSLTERNEWDSVFPFLLGHYNEQFTNFNYNVSLQPQPPGTGKHRDFHYNEIEAYWADSWKARNDLTLTYGVRWSYYGVPFEANGFQTIPSIGLDSLFSARVQNGLNGVEGPSANPLISYDLGGPVNHNRGYYEPTLTNFGPRLGIAWNPSFREGFLHRAFGDRKTTLRLGGSIVYDRVAGTVTFLDDQLSFLFQNSAAQIFGQGIPATALQTDPRFTALNKPPVAVVPPVITRPIAPFVANGSPFGEAADQFIYAADPNFKTPYEDIFGFSLQRELPANTLLEVDYVGRLGRRLFAQSDAGQLVDFKDPASGQNLIASFNNIAAEVRGGANPTNLPESQFFKSQMQLATGGATCQQISNFFFGVPFNCASFLANAFATNFANGDVTDMLIGMNAIGVLEPNVGMYGQAGSVAYVSSKSSSSYNGLLLIVRKRFSKGLQMDFDYTYSHSIDNTSSVVNTVDTGFVCDLRNLRACRGNSDFDATHIVSSDWIYELPFGRNRYIAKDAPRWADEIIGGWNLSGIWTWHTGFAFGTTTGSFPVSNFYGDVNGYPGVLTGSTSALSSRIHNENGVLEFFSSQTNALGAFSNPFGGQNGNRNDLRGPHFWTIDLTLLKNFTMPWREQKLQFRVDAFNVFNHENFIEPGVNINAPGFGALTTTRGEGARQMQFGLIYRF